MIQAILTRLGSRHQQLRTDEVAGVAEELPAVGKCFAMIAAPLNENAFVRVVETTQVKEIRSHVEEGALEFWTENSHYGLQILDMGTNGSMQ